MASSATSSARPVVLVVDDETASDGLEALNIIEAWGPAIRVVVTDVRMPRLSGPALAAHLARLDRSPAVLFVSGFTDADVPAEVLAKLGACPLATRTVQPRAAALNGYFRKTSAPN